MIIIKCNSRSKRSRNTPTTRNKQFPYNFPLLHFLILFFSNGIFLSTLTAYYSSMCFILSTLSLFENDIIPMAAAHSLRFTPSLSDHPHDNNIKKISNPFSFNDDKQQQVSLRPIPLTKNFSYHSYLRHNNNNTEQFNNIQNEFNNDNNKYYSPYSPINTSSSFGTLILELKPKNNTHGISDILSKRLHDDVPTPLKEENQHQQGTLIQSNISNEDLNKCRNFKTSWTRKQKCLWARYSSMNDTSSSSFLSYNVIAFCYIKDPIYILFLYIPWLIFLLYLCGTVTDNYLTPPILELTSFLNMSDSLAGCTFLAVASAICDILTGISLSWNDPKALSLFVGDVFGSSLFATTATSGFVILLSHYSLIQLDRKSYYRDASFLLCGLLLFLILHTTKHFLPSWTPVSFIILYGLYVYIAWQQDRDSKKNFLLCEEENKNQKKKKKENDQKEHYNTIVKEKEDNESSLYLKRNSSYEIKHDDTQIDINKNRYGCKRKYGDKTSINKDSNDDNTKDNTMAVSEYQNKEELSKTLNPIAIAGKRLVFNQNSFLKNSYRAPSRSLDAHLDLIRKTKQYRLLPLEKDIKNNDVYIRPKLCHLRTSRYNSIVSLPSASYFVYKNLQCPLHSSGCNCYSPSYAAFTTRPGKFLLSRLSNIQLRKEEPHFFTPNQDNRMDDGKNNKEISLYKVSDNYFFRSPKKLSPDVSDRASDSDEFHEPLEFWKCRRIVLWPLVLLWNLTIPRTDLKDHPYWLPAYPVCIAVFLCGICFYNYIPIQLSILIITASLVMTAAIAWITRIKKKNFNDYNTEGVVYEKATIHRDLKQCQTSTYTVSSDTIMNASSVERTSFRFLMISSGIVMALVWSGLLVTEILQVIITLGYILEISNELFGLTVLAWGNSIADLMASVAVSRAGHTDMGLSSTFGTSIILMFFGIPLVSFVSTLREYLWPITTPMIKESIFHLEASALICVILHGLITIVWSCVLIWRDFKISRFWSMLPLGAFLFTTTLMCINAVFHIFI